MVSHKYTVLESLVPHQYSFPLEGEWKKAGAETAGTKVMYSIDLSHLFYDKKELSRGSKYVRFFLTLLRFA
jgi:hypothetical protein